MNFTRLRCVWICKIFSTNEIYVFVLFCNHGVQRSYDGFLSIWLLCSISKPFTGTNPHKISIIIRWPNCPIDSLPSESPLSAPSSSAPDPFQSCHCPTQTFSRNTFYRHWCRSVMTGTILSEQPSLQTFLW